MRLTPDEIEIIRSSARRHFGAGCTVRLFGSVRAAIDVSARRIRATDAGDGVAPLADPP